MTPDASSRIKPQELASLVSMLEKAFSPQGVSINLHQEQNCLKVILEASKTPPQSLADKIYRGFVKLNVHRRENILIVACLPGESSPDWRKSFKRVESPQQQSTDSSLQMSLTTLKLSTNSPLKHQKKPSSTGTSDGAVPLSKSVSTTPQPRAANFVARSPSPSGTFSPEDNIRQNALLKMIVGLAIFPLMLMIFVEIPGFMKLIGLLALWAGSIFACLQLFAGAKRHGEPRLAWRNRLRLLGGVTYGAPFVLMFSAFASGLGELLTNKRWETIRESSRLPLLLVGIALQTVLMYPVFKFFRLRL